MVSGRGHKKAASKIVGTKKTIDVRFCWPAQDRVRATPLSTAPRISPVFTASDSFFCPFVWVGPLAASSSSTPEPSSRLNRGAAGRRGGLRYKRGCCGVVENPGRVPICHEVGRRSVRRLLVNDVANAKLNRGQSELASGLFSRRSTRAANAIIQSDSDSLDWRIVGGQDVDPEGFSL